MSGIGADAPRALTNADAVADGCALIVARWTTDGALIFTAAIGGDQVAYQRTP